MCFHWFRIINRLRTCDNWYQCEKLRQSESLFSVAAPDPDRQHALLVWKLYERWDFNYDEWKTWALRANWLTSFKCIIYVWKCKFTKSFQHSAVFLLFFFSLGAHKIFTLTLNSEYYEYSRHEWSFSLISCPLPSKVSFLLRVFIRVEMEKASDNIKQQ